MPADLPNLGARADQAQPETEPAGDSPLDALARELAQSHTVSRRRDSASPLLNPLKDRDAFLQSAYQYFASAPPEEIAFSSAAEWVLDNFYIVRQALHLIREDMPKSYYRQLPKLDAGPLQGYPRIYAVAREMIREAKAYLDPDRLRRFSHAYQRIAPLTVGERGALPIMRRLGILECLTGALGRLTGLPSGQPLPPAVPLPETLTDDTLVANG